MKKRTENQLIFRAGPPPAAKLRRTERIAAAVTALCLAGTLWFCAARSPAPAAFSLTQTGPEAHVRWEKLDLNTAGEEALADLPGIGPVLAGRIADWRRENGPFTCREDVLSVRGVGEGVWAKIEPYVTF